LTLCTQLSAIPPDFGPAFDSDAINNDWQFARPVVWNWVEQNQHARQLAIEAARQEPGAFPIETGGKAGNPAVRMSDSRDMGRLARSSESRDMGRLARLLFYSARKFESEDELDEALACYVAVARLGSDAARAGQRTPFAADGYAFWALDWMQRWAAHPKQSTNRVKKAIDQFAAFELRPCEVSSSVLNDWRIERRDLRQALWGKSSVPAANRTVSELWWVRQFLPWELLRLERLSDAVFAADFDEADAIATDLQKHGFVTMTAERAARWGERGRSALQKYGPTTLSEPQSVELPFWGRWHEVDRLATERIRLIALAVADFQREHHKLPPSLRFLVPTYFQRLPIDPWTGRDFVYRAEGIPVQLAFSGNTLDPGSHFLASAGMWDSQLVQPFITANGTRSFEVVSRFAPNESQPRSNSLNFRGPLIRLRAGVKPAKPELPNNSF
jgi:hypothetical protein